MAASSAGVSYRLPNSAVLMFYDASGAGQQFPAKACASV
jgi:hypothetical protein